MRRPTHVISIRHCHSQPAAVIYLDGLTPLITTMSFLSTRVKTTQCVRTRTVTKVIATKTKVFQNCA